MLSNIVLMKIDELTAVGHRDFVLPSELGLKLSCDVFPSNLETTCE